MPIDIGNVYIAFPSNSYNVYWSPIIEDLYPIQIWISNVSNEPDILAFCLVHILFNYPKLMKVSNFIKNTFEVKQYFKSLNLSIDVEQYTKNDDTNTRLIYSSKFAAHEDIRLSVIKEILKKYPNCIHTFIQKMYKKDIIIEALKSGHEILAQCDTLYLVHNNIYDNVEKILKV